MNEIAVLDKFLDYDQVEDLISRLRKNPKTGLILRGNCLGAEGAQILGNYLVEETCELKSLSLEWNQLGSTGCIVLANALEKNTSVTHLDLRNNSIKNDGAHAICKCLNVNSSLRSIDIRWNQINDGICFKECLTKRLPPLKLNISGNHLPESTNILMQNWIDGEDNDEDEDEDEDVDDDVQRDQDTENNINSSSNKQNKQGTSKNNNTHTGINMSRTNGMLDAVNSRLSKETILLRKQCNSVQDEMVNLSKQLELSAVRITELEQLLLKEQYKIKQNDEILKNTVTKITIQKEEKVRLINTFSNEREDIINENKKQLKICDEEISNICIERDRAVMDMKNIQLHNENTILQMDNLVNTNNQERNTLTNEINNLKEKLNIITLSENKLRSENIIFKTKEKDSIEQLERLENESLKARETADNDYKNAIIERENSENNTRNEYQQKLSDANDKIFKQNEEMTNLHKKVAELESASSTIIADMELKCTNSVAQAREDETKRTEITISDLKNKIDMFVNSRDELEKRCQEYLNEMTENQASQKTINTRLTTQLNSSEVEIERLRTLYTTLKNENNNLNNTNDNNESELKELRQKVKLLEEVHIDMRSKLTISIKSQQDLEDKTKIFQLKQEKYDSDRQIEFFNVKKSILSTIQREFDTLQTSLGVPSQSLSAMSSPVTSSKKLTKETNPKSKSSDFEIEDEAQKEEEEEQSEYSSSGSEEESEEVGSESDSGADV
jgi:hypothetical protein